MIHWDTFIERTTDLKHIAIKMQKKQKTIQSKLWENTRKCEYSRHYLVSVVLPLQKQ